jgi:hypothetical protein
MELALLPLGAFWLTFSSLQAAAGFVNELREAVINGQKGEVALSLRHRKVLLLDWLLSMLGAVVATFMFSAILFWIAGYVESLPALKGASTIVAVVAVFPLLSGFMLLACGVSDFKLMKAVLREQQERGTPGAT